MWHVIAEEDMHCTECRHKIPSGTECLSQMPLEMPENFRRAQVREFLQHWNATQKRGVGICYI